MAQEVFEGGDEPGGVGPRVGVVPPALLHQAPRLVQHHCPAKSQPPQPPSALTPRNTQHATHSTQHAAHNTSNVKRKRVTSVAPEVGLGGPPAIDGGVEDALLVEGPNHRRCPLLRDGCGEAASAHTAPTAWPKVVVVAVRRAGCWPERGSGRTARRSSRYRQPPSSSAGEAEAHNTELQT